VALAAGAFSKRNPLIDFSQKINERVSFLSYRKKRHDAYKTSCSKQSHPSPNNISNLYK
jgi:hypothetical protein